MGNEETTINLQEYSVQKANVDNNCISKVLNIENRNLYNTVL